MQKLYFAMLARGKGRKDPQMGDPEKKATQALIGCRVLPTTTGHVKNVSVDHRTISLCVPSSLQATGIIWFDSLQYNMVDQRMKFHGLRDELFGVRLRPMTESESSVSRFTELSCLTAPQRENRISGIFCYRSPTMDLRWCWGGWTWVHLSYSKT
jgi:hypothetical protein